MVYFKLLISLHQFIRIARQILSVSRDTDKHSFLEISVLEGAKFQYGESEFANHKLEKWDKKLAKETTSFCSYVKHNNTFSN